MDEQIEISDGCRLILRRLISQERIGGANIPEAIVKAWVKNLPKIEHKKSMKDWERCIRAGLIMTKPKPYGLQVSLNPRKLSEIRELTR